MQCSCFFFFFFFFFERFRYPTQLPLRGVECGTLFVLVSPCFRKNVVVTCKIGSFVCSSDDLHQKYVIVFFCGNQISKWRSFEKGAIFTYFLHFLVTRESYKNSFSTSHSHTCMYFAHPIDFFFFFFFFFFLPYRFWKKKYEFIRYGFSLVWVPVLILIRAILEQSINNKMVRKI